MADYPLAELDGKTPLEVANKPVMDELAGKGQMGLAKTIPEGMSPGSDTANLAVLGYNPRKYYTGRSPLEALSIGVDLKETDVALRCNIVTLSDDEKPYEEKTIIDHSSSEISTEDAEVLLNAVKKEFKIDNLKCNEMKPQYFHINCVETVKQSLSSFLDSYDFEDAIRNAIALGGDSDTLAAITGSIAAAYYGIPDEICEKALDYLDGYLISIHDCFYNKFEM